MDLAQCLDCDANGGVRANEGSYTGTEETDVDQFLLDCTSSRVVSGQSNADDIESIQEMTNSNRNSFSFGNPSVQTSSIGAVESNECASPSATPAFRSVTDDVEPAATAAEDSVLEFNAATSSEDDCLIEMEEDTTRGIQSQIDDSCATSNLMLDEDEGTRLPLISREGLRKSYSSRTSILVPDRLRKSTGQVDYLRSLYNQTGGKLDRKQRKRAIKATGLSWI